MRTRSKLTATAILAALSLAVFPRISSAAADAPRPNILLIMVDDMGFSDIGCYGGEIKTPNIDALAKGGVRFAEFYNNARCCPTRATLMTGLAPHQAGIGHMTAEPDAARNKGTPAAYQGNINENCVTLAQIARGAGYATFMTGKWHLSGSNQEDWPLQRGFEKYYGCISGATRYFEPTGVRIMYSGNEADREPKSTTSRPFYTTDAFTDHGLEFLAAEKGSGTNRPFFWYLAFTAPHWPLQAHDEDIAKYQGKYDIGWDAIREQRYKRQLELGLIDPKWKLSPRARSVPAWESLDPEQKKDLSLRMTIYAAMVDRVDQNIGKIVAFLKERGLFENTLILFLSDNGACAEGGVYGQGGKVGDKAQRNASNNISIGEGWANVSSTPFRLYKHFAHEGGTATPFFAHWPARIKPRAQWYKEPGQVNDVMPTVVQLTGGSYPKVLNGHEILLAEGVSLVPSFSGETLGRKRPILMEHENNAFIREGDWKLVGRDVAPPRGLDVSKWQLYNMAEDRTELNNLAEAMPERVQAMSDKWSQWANRVGVYPKRQPANAQ